MFFTAWSGVSHFTAGVRGRTAAIIVWSLLGGFAETFALMATVRVALAVGAGEAGSITVPVVEVEVPGIVIMGVALVASVFTLIAHVMISRLSATMTASVLERSRKAAVHAFVGASWEVQSAEREGVLQETVTTLTRNMSSISASLVSTISNGIMLVIFLVCALVLSPIPTLIILAAGLLLGLTLRPIAGATNRAATAFTRRGAHYAEEISRFTSTSMEYKVFGVESAAEANLAADVEAVAQGQRRSRFLSMLGSNLFRDIAVILLVIGVSGLLLASGSIDASAAIVVITLVVRALSSAQQVNTSNQQIHEASPNLALLRERIATWEAGRERDQGRDVPEIERIELRDVGYRYPQSDRGVGPLNLVVTAGESIGVIGKSGAGKSTLVQLVLRLRRPNSGDITVNGEDYTAYSAESWSRATGFVPQEPSLLEATIAENIDFARGLSRSAIEQAARDAHVYDDIMALADGFETVLGPRGAGLSGGQKQRVAIARALAGSPQVLLLDEPSSALDPQSERLLAETLAALKGRTTLLIIAHRLTTVRDCDRIIAFEGGRIAQAGTPAELLGAEGYFRDRFTDAG